MTLRRVWLPTGNYSARGSGVRLVVLHTAQGAATYEALGNFFANPASGVSSHVGIDDTPGEIGEYVRRDFKAWTQGNANPYSVAAELCAWAEWSTAEWWNHPTMLENTARWVAEECAAFGIPLRALSPGEAQGNSAMGVCQHSSLGEMGGSHWDCGGGFPMGDVLEMAGGGAAGAAPSEWSGGNMIASTKDGAGYWTTTRDGAVGAFGSAQYAGGGFSPDVVSGEIVGIAGCGNDGYWLLASDGGVLAFGSAQFYGRPDRV